MRTLPGRPGWWTPSRPGKEEKYFHNLFLVKSKYLFVQFHTSWEEAAPLVASLLFLLEATPARKLWT